MLYIQLINYRIFIVKWQFREAYMWSKYKDDVYQCIIVAIGCAIFGVGIDAFVLPHKLVSTGISGVGLILYYITGLSIGTWNVI